MLRAVFYDKYDVLMVDSSCCLILNNVKCGVSTSPLIKGGNVIGGLEESNKLFNFAAMISYHTVYKFQI